MNRHRQHISLHCYHIFMAFCYSRPGFLFKMSSDLVQAINRFLASGAYKEQLSLIKGIRNGIV